MTTEPATMPSMISKEWRAKVAGTLINPSTLLATDYMNHFNEVVMMIEMLPMMPEMLDDCVAWRSKTYPQHFIDIKLDYSQLAADAYQFVPSSIKVPFELTVAQLNAVIGLTVKRASAHIAASNQEELSQSIALSMTVLRRLVGALAGIINGSLATVDQAEIDAILEQKAAAPQAAQTTSSAQDEINKLFD
jgi:hypothetical protein